MTDAVAPKELIDLYFAVARRRVARLESRLALAVAEREEDVAYYAATEWIEGRSVEPGH